MREDEECEYWGMGGGEFLKTYDILGSGLGGTSHVGLVGRGSDHAGDDEKKVTLGQEEVVKVEGKGRSCLGEIGTTRQHLKSLMCLKNSLLSGICA